MKKLLTLLSCVFLLALLGCPAIPPTYIGILGVTLSTYEVKAGDAITIDTQGIPVFSKDYNVRCYVKTTGTPKIIKESLYSTNLDKAVPIIYYDLEDGSGTLGLLEDMELIEKISDTKASFRVPEYMITGSVRLFFDQYTKNDIEYLEGVSTEPVTIIE